ncbi:apolipoprotein N-acyltransferase [Candidatus Mycobacterium methanotrophicum]|uniref:Apolipoprotein N-acyltransferase n=1 Tax=Candidatus Mycobacterium methanotrophicum TaxID=2943498 RepID=A0ABY4QHG1_9MYCO|nr:apolipoprotein N-acyltransferase [Candidatus Mycobacterium methanotrophicum]UQX09421.1 apolipoprotein N-acyltransferase [Candidatus Mycobacterium methanotrophicum]
MRSDDSEVIPVAEDDGTGVTPVQHGDPDNAEDTAGADDDRPLTLGNRGRQHATDLGQRLVRLGGVLLVWLANQQRTRLPQFGNAVRPRLTRLSAAILAGLLLCSSYPGLNWWWAAIIAFAVLAWVLTRPATTPLGGFGYGFLFGVAFYLPLIRWVSILVGAVPLLALVGVCALFPAIFGLLAVVVRRLPGWPIWFAVLWAAQEWLKSTVPFGGFPWGVVAAGQTDGPFLPLVRLGGVPLLSLAIVLVACSTTAIALEIASWLRASHVQRADSPPAVMFPAICICLAFSATAAIWPQVRHSGTGSGNEPVVTAAVVQGNVPRLGLEFNAQRLAVLGNDVRETRQLTADVHVGRAPQPDFVVWPEDASEVDPLRNPDAAQKISAAVEAIDAPILVGTVLDVAARTQKSPAETNTVIVWNPKTGPGERHDKRIVQPFGEYLPWRGFFRRLSGLADWAGYIVPGTGTGVVRAAGVPVGVATCWEVIFDRALRDSVLGGAEVLAVPANNANFNQTMSEQQLAFSKVRAVELDRYAVVASNVGISALVTPDGRELSRTGFFEAAYLDNQVRRKTTLTPAAKWGPIVQGSLVVAAAAVLLAAMLQNGWFTEINRRLSELVKNVRPANQKPDDDSLGDDVVADGELDKDGQDAALDESGRHSARMVAQRPENGDP